MAWRPHVLLTAKSSSGKTWITQEVARAVLGDVVHSIVDTSDAGLSRLTGNDAIPVLVDEAEPDALLLILRTLRSATSGDGMRVRAAQNRGGYDVQRARFCALMSAIAAPNLTRANATRLTRVRLGAAVADWPQVEAAILSAVRAADAIRSRIIRGAARIVAYADKCAKTLQSAGYDSREALATAALSAGWHEWGLDREWVFANVATPDRTDAGDALSEIFGLSERVGDRAMTLWRLLCSQNAGEQRLAGEQFGCRREGTTGVFVAATHSGLIKRLRGSVWQAANLSDLLLQLPGTVQVDGSVRICPGVRSTRTVWIPAETLRDAGLEFEAGELKL